MDIQDQSAVGRLMEVMRQLRRTQLNKISFEGYNASMLRVLFLLGRGCGQHPEGMTVSEISSRMEVTPPTVTPLIKSLEAEGLILRVNDQEDRRVVRVLLTEEGQALRKRAMEMSLDRMKRISEHLGQEKTEQLAGLLEEVVDYLNHRDGQKTE
ncbi:MarR family winged helix-turn-helix transcriptional regulator [Paenibacillus physcomitrellae]|uniref:Transcriptional regulator n=1 Tax=Paenibacillus physcomitrellae TaxID=1619311 RepID=A0ABQ1GF37_9BACL|nr:MarR family transcriptional regulator [Paenibacillus physcomitrellae]GGA42483.1 transcriptional regulator [Paenibacillus physcomitrellae]